VAHTLLLADDSVTIQRVIELTFADEELVAFHRLEGEREGHDRSAIAGAQLRTVGKLFNEWLKR
jgi:hypothetical protein